MVFQDSLTKEQLPPSVWPQLPRLCQRVFFSFICCFRFCESHRLSFRNLHQTTDARPLPPPLFFLNPLISL